jgi:hypothetical protein
MKADPAKYSEQQFVAIARDDYLDARRIPDHRARFRGLEQLGAIVYWDGYVRVSRSYPEIIALFPGARL